MKKYIISIIACLLFAVCANAATYTPIAPCRILDTRVNAIPPAVFATPLDAGTTYGYNYLSFGCIPTPNGDPHATAIAANITVINASAPGFLVLWPDLTPMPGTSNINFSAGQVLDNSAIIGVGTNDYFDIHYVHSLGATVDITIDVVGYFSN